MPVLVVDDEVVAVAREGPAEPAHTTAANRGSACGRLAPRGLDAVVVERDAAAVDGAVRDLPSFVPPPLVRV